MQNSAHMVGARVLGRSDSKEARRWAAYSLQRGLQRMTGDSLEKKYINVVGGHFGCPDVCIVAYGGAGTLQDGARRIL